MRRTKKPPLPPAPGGLSFVLELVNAQDHVAATDSWTNATDLRDWLVQHELVNTPGKLGDADVEHAKAVRHGLRALIVANSGGKLDAKAVAALDRQAADASCRVRFDDDGEVRLEPGAESLGGALGRICGIVALAKAEGLWPRVKICANPSCRRAFYDASRSRPSRCCTPQCRNRLHSRNYRRANQKRRGRRPSS